MSSFNQPFQTHHAQQAQPLSSGSQPGPLSGIITSQLQGTAPFTSLNQSAPVLPTANRIMVVGDSSALYQQLCGVIQLRETAIEYCQPAQVSQIDEATVSLWVVALNQVAHRPNWMLPLLDDNKPMVVVLPQWHDEAAVGLFDAGVSDLLVAPVPDVYLATRVLRVLQTVDEQDKLAQAHAVLAHQNLRNSAGVWSYQAVPTIIATMVEASPRLNTMPVSIVLWNFATMSPQVASQLQHQLVALCRGDDVVSMTPQPNQIATILPATNEAACQGFLNRVHQVVPGILNHHYQYKILGHDQGDLNTRIRHVLGL
jgi:hypothetical protein